MATAMATASTSMARTAMASTAMDLPALGRDFQSIVSKSHVEVKHGRFYSRSFCPSFLPMANSKINTTHLN